MHRIKYLEGLRGLAAFVVVFHHFILTFFPVLFFGFEGSEHLSSGVEQFISGTPLNLFYNGNFAVCIFFVLSGFVLSHKFFLHNDSAILTEGVAKRYVRLAIPVAFSIFCAWLLMKLNLMYNQPVAAISGSGWFQDFWVFTPRFGDAVRQMFIGTFFTNDFAYNAVLWAIAVEFFGSLLVFAFLAIFGKMHNRYLAYILVAWFFIQTYYLAFILGLALSDIMAHKETILKKFSRSKYLRLILLLIGLFLGSYPSGRGADGTVYSIIYNNYFPEFDIFCHIIGAFLIILVLLNSKRIQKVLSHKYLFFLGEVAFGVYLLHFLILGSFSSFVFLKLIGHLPYMEAVLISFVLSLVLIYAAGYFVYIYIDKNAAYFSKFIYNRLFKGN